MSLDIWTSIWTILSFIVLYFILRFLLFKPIIKIMDERKAKIKEGLSDKAKAEEEAAAARAGLDSQIKQANISASELIAERKQTDKKAKEEAAISYREEADALIKNTSKDVEELKSREDEALKTQMNELVNGLSGKILGRTIDQV